MGYLLFEWIVSYVVKFYSLYGSRKDEDGFNNLHTKQIEYISSSIYLGKWSTHGLNTV